MPKKDIKSIALDALKAIKKADMAIEINSAGFRKPIKEQYPSQELLELAYELNIPITFSSDAHAVNQIGFEYEKAVKLAKKVGYNSCVYFNNREKVNSRFKS